MKMEQQEARERLDTFLWFYPRLHRTLESHGTRAVWVFHPMSPNSGPKMLTQSRWLNEHACREVEAIGGRCHDLQDALSDTHFFSLTHFNARGHQRMAALLWETIAGELP